jgi:hypothetical protein
VAPVVVVSVWMDPSSHKIHFLVSNYGILGNFRRGKTMNRFDFSPEKAATVFFAF